MVTRVNYTSIHCQTKLISAQVTVFTEMLKNNVRMLGCKFWLLVGSITSRCSGKWARTHPPMRIKDRTRETTEIEPRLLADGKDFSSTICDAVSLIRTSRDFRNLADGPYFSLPFHPGKVLSLTDKNFWIFFKQLILILTVMEIKLVVSRKEV